LTFSPSQRLSQPEFIGLIAMLFAMVAFSIDAMLPALPDIAAEISPDAPNRAQLILTSFVFGMGLGTLVTGPLSDRFGRKPVILCGAALYILGAAVAWQASTLNEMLAARVVQGLGVAGPRVVALAIIRDIYEGRRMAQIMSYAMMIFTLVPAIAPFMGAIIIDAFGWRMIFAAFIAFCLIATTWLALRQPETLPPERRQPFAPRTLARATRECFSHRIFTLSTLTQALTFGMLFGTLSSIHALFDNTFGRGDSFPAWFALIAVIGGSASIINARLVIALGMRRMIQMGLGGLTCLSAIVALTGLVATIPFALFMLWATAIFFMVGLVIGNLNALAMEPLGHIAGLAASVIGASSTVLGVVLAIPLGLAFNGTPVPLAIGLSLLSFTGFLLIRFGLR
jgi:DHA1 family bicyclomycin/chloramphenicol resistance-like MFS transporter